jgi:hypothetical protein
LVVVSVGFGGVVLSLPAAKAAKGRAVVRRIAAIFNIGNVFLESHDSMLL